MIWFLKKSYWAEELLWESWGVRRLNSSDGIVFPSSLFLGLLFLPLGPLLPPSYFTAASGELDCVISVPLTPRSRPAFGKHNLSWMGWRQALYSGVPKLLPLTLHSCDLGWRSASSPLSLPSRGPLAMSGGVCGCHTRRRAGFVSGSQWVETQGAAHHPTI